MYLEGTTRKFEFREISAKKKPHWFILMPKSKVKSLWQAVSHTLLIYTAIFVPFQVAFLSGEQYQTKELYIID
jgi:hypothetical protein